MKDWEKKQQELKKLDELDLARVTHFEDNAKRA